MCTAKLLIWEYGELKCKFVSVSQIESISYDFNGMFVKIADGNTYFPDKIEFVEDVL